MKHTAVVCVALAMLCLPAIPLQAQGFHDVHSPDGFSVWAVGAGGTVFRSSDGGATWSRSTHGSSTLRSVSTLGSRIWIVGGGGTMQVSSDAGESWVFSSVNGGITLRSVAFSDAAHGWAVGDNGTVISTADGGSSWVGRSAGTKLRLTAVAASDSLTVYAAGEAGALLRSGNGGESWTMISADGWFRPFLGLDVAGQTVVVTGADGACFRSTDAGGSWTALDLQTDSRSDVADVHIITSDSIAFTGGGGYVRTTADGGGHYRYGLHGLHAPLKKIFFIDRLRGWACSEATTAILRTTDGGATWALPTGTTTTLSWSQRLSASSSIGNTFAINPWDNRKLYVALGRFIYMSADKGQTWTQTAAISATAGSTHSFYISPKDTNVYLVAFTGGGDRVMRSTDRGLSWTTTIIRNFSSFGMPVEMDGSHPDTLLFGPEDGYLYRSLDFGATWDTLSRPDFNSPCDLQIVRDSAGIVWVGDSGPSRISRSTDGGLTWSLVYDGGTSEIPTIANGRSHNGQGFATAWGSGGLQKTTNYGLTWTTVTTTGSTWGVDIARDDPTVVMFGVYGGGMSYLSTNAGGTFTATPISGSNYAILAYDRATFFAQQSGGVWKMNITYSVPVSNARTVTLVSPNGGEAWQYGTVHPIVWTSGNLASIRIEYRTSPAEPWQTITAGTPADAGSYPWTLPDAPTTQASVRISDAANIIPSDSGAAPFTIAVPSVAVSAGSLSFGAVDVGALRRDTVIVTNAGTGTLVVFSAQTTSAAFLPGRTSFTIPAGGSDTLGIVFVPPSAGTFRDTLRLTTNAPAAEVSIALAGVGTPGLSVAEDLVPDGLLLEQNYPNPFNGETRIGYRVRGAGNGERVTLAVYDVLGREVATLVNGTQPAGEHSVGFDAKGLPSGVYIYRLQTGAVVEQKRMILVK